MNKGVLGLFKYVDKLLAAAERLKRAGHGVTIFSSVPLDHEIEHEFGERKSYLKYFSFFGACAGFMGAIVVALGTSALYPLPRGGRAIFAITPTLLLAYVLTILVGVGMTFLGFLYLSGLPDFFKKRVDEPEIAVDAFGLLVGGIEEDGFDEIERVLKECGAHDVKKVEEED